MIGNRVVHGAVMASAKAVAVVAAATLFLLAPGDRAQAAREVVTIPCTSWAMLGTAKIALGGSGTQQGVVDGLLRFGPLDELLADEFDLVVAPSGPAILVSGTCTEPKPGKVLCVVDPTGLETQLEALLSDDLGTPVDMTMAKTTMKVKPKSKDGIETIRIFFNSKARMCINDGERIRCKNFRLQYKAVSVET